jgi:hypothetical protein
MLRKFLALFFIVSWVGASGYDLLEDLDLSADVRAKNAQRSAIPVVEKFAKLANDSLEKVDHPPPSFADVPKRPGAKPVFSRLDAAPLLVKEKFRLYKLHRVFLI